MILYFKLNYLESDLIIKKINKQDKRKRDKKINYILRFLICLYFTLVE